MKGNILPDGKRVPLGKFDLLGLSVFAASLAFEVRIPMRSLAFILTMGHK